MSLYNKGGYFMRYNIHVVTVNTEEKADKIAKLLGNRYLHTLTYYIDNKKIGGYDVVYLNNIYYKNKH